LNGLSVASFKYTGDIGDVGEIEGRSETGDDDNRRGDVGVVGEDIDMGEPSSQCPRHLCGNREVEDEHEDDDKEHGTRVSEQEE